MDKVCACSHECDIYINSSTVRRLLFTPRPKTVANVFVLIREDIRRVHKETDTDSDATGQIHPHLITLTTIKFGSARKAQRQ